MNNITRVEMVTRFELVRLCVNLKENKNHNSHTCTCDKSKFVLSNFNMRIIKSTVDTNDFKSKTRRRANNQLPYNFHSKQVILLKPKFSSDLENWSRSPN